MARELRRRSEVCVASYRSDDFLDQVVASFPGQKIVTFTSARAVGNFDMFDAEVPAHGRRAVHRLRQLLRQARSGRGSVCAIVVRQFTDRVDDATGLPWKNVYAFAANGDCVWRYSAETNRVMQCTDCVTGSPLAAEPSVNYLLQKKNILEIWRLFS